MRVTKKAALTGGAVLASTTMVAAGIAGTLTSASGSAQRAGTVASGQLNPLNNSGVVGQATVKVDGKRLHIDLDARGLDPNLPHAQHIHFGKRAANECPNIELDENGDFRLTTAEGVPAYGPVRVSLTLDGDTSAKSTLAVDRYPTAPGGRIDYERHTHTGERVADGIRRGEAVVVIHGVDYNDNGEYDFKSAGKSELDPNLPAEATDPAACGLLRVAR